METPNTNNPVPGFEPSDTPVAAVSPHLLFSTDYRLPEGHPERYAAVYASEEEMTTMAEMVAENQYVYYRQKLGDSVLRAVMPAREAKAMFLAETEHLKIHGSTMPEAMIWATQIGLTVTRPMPLQ